MDEKKKEKNPAAVALGKMSAAKAGAVGMSKKGRKGGKARAAALSPERQSEIGRKAIAARWAKYRAAKEKEAAEDA